MEWWGPSLDAKLKRYAAYNKHIKNTWVVWLKCHSATAKHSRVEYFLDETFHDDSGQQQSFDLMICLAPFHKNQQHGIHQDSCNFHITKANNIANKSASINKYLMHNKASCLNIKLNWFFQFPNMMFISNFQLNLKDN